MLILVVDDDLQKGPI